MPSTSPTLISWWVNNMCSVDPGPARSHCIHALEGPAKLLWCIANMLSQDGYPKELMPACLHYCSTSPVRGCWWRLVMPMARALPSLSTWLNWLLPILKPRRLCSVTCQQVGFRTNVDRQVCEQSAAVAPFKWTKKSGCPASPSLCNASACCLPL